MYRATEIGRVSSDENKHDCSVNKAVYTAALVADGWAGAENLEKELCDRRTDGPTEK